MYTRRLFYQSSFIIILSFTIFCVSCDADYVKKRIDEAPRFHYSLSQVEYMISSLNTGDRDAFLLQFEGFAVAWSGKVVEIKIPETADHGIVVVSDSDSPDSSIFLLLKRDELIRLAPGAEISYEGIIDSFGFDNGLIISITPARLISREM